MARGPVGAAPRRVGGGRSDRYDERRAQRGAGARRAQEWSDASAAAVLESVLHKSSNAGEGILQHIVKLLSGTIDLEVYVRSMPTRLGPMDRATAVSVMEDYRGKMAGMTDPAALKSKARSFLKPLRVRSGRRVKMLPLVVRPASFGPETFHAWLSDDASKDRLRDMAATPRITEMVFSWPLHWMEGTIGVICVERAKGRIRDERGGKVDEAFVRGLVKTKSLPTALANASNHYVLVSGGAEGRCCRYMSVEEVCRSCGLASPNPLRHMLTSPDVLTPIQAVSCLGRGIHVGVALQLLRQLKSEGLLKSGLSYGSSYSGIDMFAAALDYEMNGEWFYEFASECDPVARSGLLDAWYCRGLVSERVYENARGREAVDAPYVDLWVCTPTCEAYSKRNHNRNDDTQRATLGDVWDALEYVRYVRPEVVVMENVNDASATGPLTGLLSRIDGYTLRGGVLEPSVVALAPVARERHFWVLTRDGD